MARRRKKYLAIVQFRVYRDLTIRCWSLNVDGSSFLLSHPTPSEAAKPPKPIPFQGLALNSSMASSFLSNSFTQQEQGKVRAGQGQGPLQSQAGQKVVAKAKGSAPLKSGLNAPPPTVRGAA